MPPTKPWFAGKEATVLLFKVNRRPLPQITMRDDLVEADPFDHVQTVLPFGQPVSTGRRYRRTWYLGNAEEWTSGVLVGQVGWQVEEAHQWRRGTGKLLSTVGRPRWGGERTLTTGRVYNAELYNGDTHNLSALSSEFVKRS